MRRRDDPQEPTLSEADRADAELFLTDLRLCLPVIGVELFEEIKRTVPLDHARRVGALEQDGQTASSSSSMNQLVLAAKGVKARGYAGAGGFAVRKEAQVVKEEVPSIHPSTRQLRATLRKNGVLQDKGDCHRFTRNYVVRTPSTASAVVAGRTLSTRSGR